MDSSKSCINLNSSDAIEWLNNTTIEDMYTQYIKNGYYLPSWDVYSKVTKNLVPISTVRNQLSDIINVDDFRFSNIKDLLYDLPPEGQAAFWNNVFYFRSQVSTEHIGEEGFHALFQTVFSEEVRNKLLSIGSKLINVTEKVEDYSRRFPSIMSPLTEEERRERVIEEKLAQEFRTWYAFNPRNITSREQDIEDLQKKYSFLPKGLVEILYDFFDVIRQLFNIPLRDRRYLESLFKSIMDGKYRKEKAKVSETSTPSLFTLYYENETGGLSPLSESESIHLANIISSTYLRYKQTEQASDDMILEDTLEAVREYINNSDKNYLGSILTPSITEYNYEDDNFIERSIPNPEYEKLLEEVKNRIVKYSEIIDRYQDEDQGDNMTDENFEEYLFSDSVLAQEKGFEGWSSWLREYISTVGVSNTYVQLENNKQVEVVEPIDVNKLYFGVARSLQNTENDFKRLQKLILFGSINDGENITAKSFVYQLIGDVLKTNDKTIIADKIQSISELSELDENIAWDIINNNILKGGNKQLLNGILKGFDLWRRDEITQLINPSSGEVRTINSNTNGNVISTQIRKWKNNYEQSERNEEVLGELKITLENSSLENNSNILNSRAYQFKKAFKDQLGIDVSLATIKYLLISENPSFQLPIEEKNIYDIFSTDVSSLTKEFKGLLNGILSNVDKLGKNRNLYSEYESQLDPTLSTIFSRNFNQFSGGILSRLEALAEINSVFDENVMENTYKNAENKTIYAFQYKTFGLQSAKLVKDPKYIEQILNKGLVEYSPGKWLTEGQEFIKENILLKGMYSSYGGYERVNSTFKQLSQLFKMETFGGIREIGMNEGEGVTFGNITTPEFDAFRLNLADSRKKSVKINGKGYNLIPVYIGNYEAKRTAEFIYLPEITGLVDNTGKITEKGISLLKDEIKKEYNRIVKISSLLKRGFDTYNPFTQTDENITEVNMTPKIWKQMLGKDFDVINKYHTGPLKRVELDGVPIYKGIRALEFTNNIVGLLGEEQLNNLLESALLRQEFDTAWTYDNNLNSTYTNIMNTTIDNIDAGIISKNWKKDRQLNRPLIKQFLLNQHLNTLAYNQLLHGDNALLFKSDGVDFQKRGGGINATLQGGEFHITKNEWGINSPVTHYKYVVGTEFKGKVAYNPSETVDAADAQNWGTTKHFRNQLWAQGKLNEKSAKFLDKIELGLPLTEEDNRNGVYFNVMKTVGYNGYQYIKTSVMMLTKHVTSMLTQDAQAISDDYFKQLDNLNLNKQRNFDEIESVQQKIKELYRDENNWMPKIGREFLHNLRISLEKNDIDLYMPESASKMLNINIHDNISDPEFNNINESVMQIEAQYYGLQLENPAGKDRIYDPTQISDIIFNEQDKTIEVFVEGEYKNLGEVEELYDKYLAQRTRGVYNVTRNEIVLPNGEFNIPVLFNRMIEMLVQSDSDIQTVDVFKKGLNPNIGITKDKFQDLYFSIFTKGVLKQKVSGDARAHISSVGFNSLKAIVRYPVKGTEDFVYSWESVDEDSHLYKQVAYSNNYEKLEFNTDDSLVIYDGYNQQDQLRTQLEKNFNEGKLFFVDELRHIVPRYRVHEDGTVDRQPIAYYTEAIMPKWNPDIDISDLSKWAFSTRIPSQDKHSAANLKWTSILPFYYGNSVITAKEIVAISGSDFDVDKLFITVPESYKYKGQIYFYGMSKIDQDSQLTDWQEYLNALKQYHRGFSKEYSNLVKTFRESNNEFFEELSPQIKTQKELIRSLKNQIGEIRNQQNQGYDSNQMRTVKSSLQSDLKTSYEELNRLYEDLETLNDSLRQRFFDDIQKLLSSFNLPSFEDYKYKGPFIVNGEYINPLVLSNKILHLRQVGLTNPSTLEEKNGHKAIYKTPATQDELKNLQNLAVDNNDNLMFKDSEGNNLFGSKKNIPLHTFLSHSETHKNNTTGKRNIAIAVNSNPALITLIKGEFSVNKNFITKINGHIGNKFGFYSQKEERIFNSISTLISAATDEAKDQQNATYNISLPALNILRVMLGLGYSMETSIAFINQPISRKYLEHGLIRNRSVISPSDRRVLYQSNNDFLKEIKFDPKLISKKEYGNNELSENLRENQNDTSFDNRILFDLLKFEKISNQFDMLNRIVKLKKGFDKGLNQLDQIEEAIESLEINKTDKNSIKEFIKKSPIDTYKFKDKNLVVLNEYLSIIKDQQNLTSKLFIEKSKTYKQLKNRILVDLKPNLNSNQIDYLNNSIQAFINIESLKRQGSLEINPELLESGEDSLANQILRLKNTIRNLSESEQTTIAGQHLLSLVGNTALNKLSIQLNQGGYDVISLNTFSKISNEEQDSLMTSFSNMHVALVQASDQYPEFENIAMDLFNYFVTKDALQFKSGSISKIFPVEFFSNHSEALTNIINEGDVLSREKFMENFTKDVDSYRLFDSADNIFPNNKKTVKNGKLIIDEISDISNFPTYITHYTLDEADMRILHLFKGNYEESLKMKGKLVYDLVPPAKKFQSVFTQLVSLDKNIPTDDFDISNITSCE